MAVESRLIGIYTEIYTSGGGYLTQSYPTNFHQFFKRKMLTKNEKIEDFKEVTEAEKTALEKSDAAYQEPPQSFIDQWNSACGVYGTYNKGTGYFELNGLTDITYEQAINIYQRYHSGADQREVMMGDVRTNIPVYNYRNGIYTNFASFSRAEVLNMSLSVATESVVYNMAVACPNLREFYGFTLSNGTKLFEPFTSCARLVRLEIKGLWSLLDVRFSPLLNIDSFKYLITNRYGSDAFNIKVHPDVYAKLTGDTTNAAVEALSEEELAEWMSLLDLAIEKNITFITTT